jgi:AraC-like DNA-binding protein
MAAQTLFIKNMVCDRCIRVVREELQKLGFEVRAVALGEATVAPRPGTKELSQIRSSLRESGFDLLDDEKGRLVQETKNAVISLVRSDRSPGMPRLKDSEFIAKAVGRDYRSLSRLFSDQENMTIETYAILQKVERIKELIKYDELPLKEIAYRMGYSSLAHLSGQFRKVTGISAREFRNKKGPLRKPLDSVR